MEWWNGKDEMDGKLRRHKMPHLYLLAMAALAAVPNSADSERDFSASGLLLSDLRTRLSTWRVDAMVFMQRNRRPAAGRAVVPASLSGCKRKSGEWVVSKEDVLAKRARG